MSDLGPLVKQLRIDKGLTLKELAGRVGSSSSTLLSFERGDKTIALGLLERVLAEFGLGLRAESPGPLDIGIMTLESDDVVLIRPSRFTPPDRLQEIVSRLHYLGISGIVIEKEIELTFMRPMGPQTPKLT